MVGGEQGWHRPWESRARVAMTTAGSEAAPSGGAVGWGLAEGSKFGTAPWGRFLLRPSPILSFLGKYPSSRTPPPQGIAPWPCSPSPGALLAASPAAASGQLPVPCIPAAGRLHGTHLLAAPGLPSPTCTPTPSPSPFCHPQPPDYIRASCLMSTCPRSRPALDPSTPLHLPLDPTLTHTDADQCVHDGSEGLHILTLSHGPTMSARPRCPIPAAAANPGLMQEPVGVCGGVGVRCHCACSRDSLAQRPSRQEVGNSSPHVVFGGRWGR